MRTLGFRMSDHPSRLGETISQSVLQEIAKPSCRVSESAAIGLWAYAPEYPSVKQNRLKFRAGFIEPMLCAPVKELPEGPGWEYELKLDGYRALGLKSDG